MFPNLCSCQRERLSDRLAELLEIFDKIAIGKHVSWGGALTGRRRIDWRSIARAFIAKSFYDLATTDLLIEMLRLQPTLRRICGFEMRRDIPSAATFSRVFKEFAETKLGDRVLDAMVKTHVGDKIVLHASTDATEIDARENGIVSVKGPVISKPAKKRGRPKKGEVRPPKEPTRIEQQLKETPQQSIAQLSRVCNWGTKTNSQGKKHTWKGYKTHITWADDNIPLAAITTSASVHDSQVAIPLIRTAAERARIIYDLMDAAYEAASIRKASEDLGHVPIIDPKPHNGALVWFAPAECERYKERTTAERGNSRLKDEFGARHVRVKGHAKVHMHILFGLITLFADQLLKPLGG
ncbi:MAG: transposase [Capsulimonadaceae bacterium]|nr:transposase [Capsulimonadaceae bacterium]